MNVLIPILNIELHLENIGFLLATIFVEANNFPLMIKKVIVPAKQMLKALPDINYI